MPEQNQLEQQQNASQNQTTVTDQGNQQPDTQQLVAQVLQEARQRELALQQQIDQLRSSQTQVQQVQQQQQNNQQVTDQEYWSNPVAAITKLIGAQIAPLQQTALEVQRANAYGNLRARYLAAFPNLVPIAALIDQFMAGQEVNDGNMQIAIQRAVGQAVITNPAILTGGQQQQQNQQQQDPAIVGTINPQQQQNNQQQNNNVPAHLRPTPAQMQRQQNTQPQRRQLTENERRLMKEMNIKSEDEWFRLLEADKRVDSWVPPVPPQTGGK